MALGGIKAPSSLLRCRDAQWVLNTPLRAAAVTEDLDNVAILREHVSLNYICVASITVSIVHFHVIF
jgi:hypothetical protein